MGKSKQELATIGSGIQRVLNSPDFKAFKALRDAIENALSKPEIMASSDAVAVGKKFIELLDSRPISKKSTDAVLKPVAKAAVKAGASKAGSASKKQSGHASALTCFKGWAADPKLFKNKAAWLNHIIDKKYCDSKTTASRWFSGFRTQHSSPALEKILPPSKK